MRRTRDTPSSYMMIYVMAFIAAVVTNQPLMAVFALLLLLVTGVSMIMRSVWGSRENLNYNSLQDQTVVEMLRASHTIEGLRTPGLTGVNAEVEEMRQALNNLDSLQEIPDRPTISYDYTPSTSPYNDSQYVYTRQDYDEISRYARSHEPDTRPPVWRTGPEEFPLHALDKLGKPPRPFMPTHAVTAAENAECDYHNSGALAVDLGLLVYSGDSDKPAVYREAPVPDNARYVQPFAEVWVEEPLKGGGIRLLLLDPDGALHFTSQATFDKKDAKASGRHTVLSPTRLPVGAHLPLHQDGWTLRVEVRGKCVAEHKVNWYTPGSANALVDHMATDGELTVDLAALVEQVALTPLSLDELLGGASSTSRQDAAGE